jgi:tetratricopeptide (TPR) repeat protein
LEETQAVAEISRLEEIVGGDPGAPAFPALAEAHRRAGSPSEAERIAREGLRLHPDRLAGRVALGLALLDQDRTEEARSILERILDAVPDHPIARAALEGEAEEPVQALSPSPGAEAGEALDAIDDAEFEQAFEEAQADPDGMLDASRTAMRGIELGPEEEPEPLSAPDSPFATRTVADLLESQGDAERAADLRERLEREPAPGAKHGADPVAVMPRHTERVRKTLERWLENLRTGSDR